MTDVLWYTGLMMALTSINMRNMRTFRWLHLVANGFYLSYSILTEALPLAIGASLFMLIHAYQLLKLYRAEAP